MMTKIKLAVQGSFESIKHVSPTSGIEFWYARELMEILQYSRWEDFKNLILRAQKSCELSGDEISNHFRASPKMIDAGKGAQREIEDWKITRHGCYLVAQNGDPTQKDTIAMAQSYFAIQTRKQEMREASDEYIERMEARGQLKETEAEFSGLLVERGFHTVEIAVVRSEGDKALFNISTQDIKEKLGVPKKRALADFLPAVTLNAKSFATSLTNHFTKTKNVKSKSLIKRSHIKNNEDVRRLLEEKGVYPENLPAEEDMQKIERKIGKGQQKKLK